MASKRNKRIKQLGDTPYFIDEDGHLWKFRPQWDGAFLRIKQYINNRGYNVVRVWRDGVRRAYVVHVLVARTFCPLPEFELTAEPLEVRHLDGNPRNNAARNLAWGTHSENEQDKKRYARKKRKT